MKVIESGSIPLSVNGLAPLGDGNFIQNYFNLYVEVFGVNGLAPLGDGNEIDNVLVLELLEC